MNSPTRENDSGGEGGEDDHNDIPRLDNEDDGDHGLRRSSTGGRSSISEILEEEIAAGVGEAEETVITGSGYKHAEVPEDTHSEDGLLEQMQKEGGSPGGSIPDDTPSVHGSFTSSPGSSMLPSMASRPGLGSPTPSFRPFDRRFSSRLTPLRHTSDLHSPRAQSPAFLGTHSRQASVASASQMPLDQSEIESPTPPWEVVRWTKLKKLNGQIFSEPGRRNFGTPTCIAVTASIVLGTSKGTILVFDYHQNLKSIIGPGTKAVEAGAITSDRKSVV